MEDSNPRKTMGQLLVVLPTLIIMLVLWVVGVAHWFRYKDPLALIFFGYIGLFVGAGIGGYIVMPDRYKPYGRQLVMVMLGGLLLIIALVSNHGNMQIEGLFFALLLGVGPYIIIHYAIAKLVGPLIFGRIWCGWACWYAMIFDLLPYPFSHYRVKGRWGMLRYVHFAISLIMVVVLVLAIGYNGAEGTTAMAWFAMGVLMYYLIGITMALVIKDNRAFCKYLCPLAVPLKFMSRFSALKISGSPAHCENCEACVEMCPMNIRVRDYIVQEKRVLSTECVLCLTCIHVCPYDSLKLSFGLDMGGSELYDFDPSKGNRAFRAGRAARQDDSQAG